MTTEQFGTHAALVSERFKQIDVSVSNFQNHRCLDCGKQLLTKGAKRCAPCNMKLIGKNKPKRLSR